MAQTDNELLQAWVSKRETSVYEELVARHAPMVYATAKRLVRDGADAITEDCFAYLVKNAAEIHTALPVFLHTTAVRYSLDTRSAPAKGLAATVDEAVAALPPQFYQVILYRCHENQPHDAIAKNTAIARAAVQGRFEKGLEILRRQLKQRGLAATNSAVIDALTAEGADVMPASLRARLFELGANGPGKPNLAGGRSLREPQADIQTVRGGGSAPLLVGGLAAAVLLVAVLLFTLSGRGGPTEEVPPPVRPAQTASAGNTEPKSPSDTQRDSTRQPRTRRALPAAKPADEDTPPEPTPDESPSDLELASASFPPSDWMHHLLKASETFDRTAFDELRTTWASFRESGWQDDGTVGPLLAQFDDAMAAIGSAVSAGPSQSSLPAEMTPHDDNLLALAEVMALEAQWNALSGDYSAAFDRFARVFEFANRYTNSPNRQRGINGYVMDEVAVSLLQETIAWGGAVDTDYRALIRRLAAVDANKPTAYDIASLHLDYLQTHALDQGLDTTVVIPLAESVQELYGLPYPDTRQSTIARSIQSRLTNPEWSEIIGFLEAEAVVTAQIRGTMIQAAVELHLAVHEAFPNNLISLTPDYLPRNPLDPFTGDYFGYDRLETGYRIYSAGADAVNNGGDIDAWTEVGGDLVFSFDHAAPKSTAPSPG